MNNLKDERLKEMIQKDDWTAAYAFMFQESDIKCFLDNMAEHRIENTMYFACSSNYPKTINLILTNYSSSTSLLYSGLIGACTGGFVDLVTLMLDHGATNLCDGLIAACRNRKIKVAKYLLDRGATAESWLASYIASGQPEMLELLIPFASSGDFCNMLRKTIRNKDTASTEILIEHCPPKAIDSGDYQFIMILLEHGMCIDKFVINDETTLIRKELESCQHHIRQNNFGILPSVLLNLIVDHYSF